MFLRSLKIRPRLALGFGALVAIIVIISAVSAGLGGRTARSVNDMKRKAVIVADLKDILLEIREARAQTLSFIAMPDNKIMAGHAETRKRLARIEDHLGHTLTTQTSRDLFAEMQALEKQVAICEDEVIRLANASVSLTSPLFMKAFSAFREASHPIRNPHGRLRRA